MKLLENGILFNWRVWRWQGKEEGLLKHACGVKPAKKREARLKCAQLQTYAEEE